MATEQPSFASSRITLFIPDPSATLSSVPENHGWHSSVRRAVSGESHRQRLRVGCSLVPNAASKTFAENTVKDQSWALRRYVRIPECDFGGAVQIGNMPSDTCSENGNKKNSINLNNRSGVDTSSPEIIVAHAERKYRHGDKGGVIHVLSRDRHL